MVVNLLYKIVVLCATISAMDAVSSHLNVEVDRQKQTFRLSLPIYAGHSSLSQAIVKFFASLPQQGNLSLAERGNCVVLEEKISFSCNLQVTMRQRCSDFVRKARRCRHLFASAEHLERVREINSLLES